MVFILFQHTGLTPVAADSHVKHENDELNTKGTDPNANLELGSVP